jgi:hypothetical protein
VKWLPSESRSCCNTLRTEVIREQFVKLLGTEQFVDEVWNVSLDRMRNYKSYFSLDNPNNLKEKFNCQLRQSRLF